MTTTEPRKPATRYRCLLDISVHCTKGHGKPTRKKCAHCGGSLFVEYGLWGVFTWRGDGRYPERKAYHTSTSHTRANRWALNKGADLVVRWIPA